MTENFFEIVLTLPPNGEIFRTNMNFWGLKFCKKFPPTCSRGYQLRMKEFEGTGLNSSVREAENYNT
jgi:hypothetical protein